MMMSLPMIICKDVIIHDVTICDYIITDDATIKKLFYRFIFPWLLSYQQCSNILSERSKS